MELKVRIIAITEGAEELIGKSAQDLISYIARVSNPNNQLKFETGSKLIKYCITHSHWSPFEHSHLTMEIKTSRAVAAQILRHRSFTFQEFSQRYAAASDFIKYPARRQDLKNRQNSIDDMSEEDKTFFDQAQEEVWAFAKSKYDEALSRGIAKEQARFMLPLNTATTIYMTGSVRSWIHYMMVRMEQSTQLEHREIAEQCYEILKLRLPDTVEALKEMHPDIFP